MQWMSTHQIRKSFIEYFKSHGHQIVPGSSLIPLNDPTLLFTNAGMVQFKDTFLGLEPRSYTRAATVQCCVRAGGKHNDLENVGYTKRHHTFFEMLGNFSFGDYFKREAIHYAWTYLTEILAVPKEKLWVTVYRKDKESEEIWLKEMGVDPARFSRCGKKDNFWSMGDVGPCGPCTEIFYDHGPSVAGGPPGTPEQEGDRYVEIWNLVFMQHNRNINGELLPLPKLSVDTGMGLERIAAVLQGVHDNFAIDLFQYLLRALSDLVDCRNYQNKSMRVIVDHIRSSCFLIADGVAPANEGRGYVLRRIIRRAIRHGYKLGRQQPFFYLLVEPLIVIMGEAYPNLIKSAALISQVIKQEEQQFATTLEHGLKILDQEIANLSTDEIPGQVVFHLYDTYGFPPDLTADIAKERNLKIDFSSFELAMEQQRRLSQRHQQFYVDKTQQLHIAGETEFTGYHNLSDDGQVTTLLSDDNKPISKLEEGENGSVVLDRTPFYAESGGQVGDSGYLYFATGSFRVRDTIKQGKSYLHRGEMIKGTLSIDEKVHAEVDPSRQDIVLNHSATHLLHEALRRVLGNHATQKGSLVEAKRLRFDFSHPTALTSEQLRAVEHLVNQQIRANLKSEITEGSIDDAQKQGALALFGEKYEEKVRVITMGNFSKEVCGGTHVHRTGDIGFFKIISESACGSGIRRIEAVTGKAALTWVEHIEYQIQEVAELLKTHADDLTVKLQQALEENRDAKKQLEKLKQKLANQQSGSLLDRVKEVHGVKVLIAELPSADKTTLRNTLDQLKPKLGSAAIILASVHDQDIQLVAGVTKDVLSYFNASELLNQVAHKVGGKGGGRPDFAQGGGNQPHELANALAAADHWIAEKLT